MEKEKQRLDLLGKNLRQAIVEVIQGSADPNALFVSPPKNDPLWKHVGPKKNTEEQKYDMITLLFLDPEKDLVTLRAQKARPKDSIYLAFGAFAHSIRKEMEQKIKDEHLASKLSKSQSPGVLMSLSKIPLPFRTVLPLVRVREWIPLETLYLPAPEWLQPTWTMDTVQQFLALESIVSLFPSTWCMSEFKFSFHDFAPFDHKQFVCMVARIQESLVKKARTVCNVCHKDTMDSLGICSEACRLHGPKEVDRSFLKYRRQLFPTLAGD